MMTTLLYDSTKAAAAAVEASQRLFALKEHTAYEAPTAPRELCQ